jgi:hypothetical protein
MVMANMIAHVVDIKRAFLHGEFKDGENRLVFILYGIVLYATLSKIIF